MKNVAVVIVVYKFPQIKLDELLNSLQKEYIKRQDIYIVDNTVNNIGYGEGINSVVKKVLKKYDYFLILNPDITIQKPFISPLLNIFKVSDSVDIVGPKILDENGKIWGNGGIIDPIRFSGGLKDTGKEDIKEQTPFSCDFVSGTAMLIKREVFEKIGFFSKEYFLYYEDVDFCMRARKAGFSVVINPGATIIHNSSSIVGKDSPTMQYYMARNHLLFQEKFAPLNLRVREMLRLPKTLMQARKNELLGIKDYFLRRFGKNEDIPSKADIS